MNAIILLGGPGAGKGTLAEALQKQTDFLHVSTGDMLRAAIQSDSAIGREAKTCMDQGNLVPDALILRMIEERVDEESNSAGFLFDGFPRTLDQAEGLDRIFSDREASIDHVFNLIVPREALLKRLTGRRVCRDCGAVYHVESHPPEKEGVCDKCGGELYQRSDDSEETILNRLDVYRKKTAPLIEYYKGKGLLRNIDAAGSVAQTVSHAMKHLTP
jgi:adenylate kinase